MNLDLAKKAHLFKSVVDNLPYSTGIFDREAKYLYTNKIAEGLCGIPNEQVVGKTPYDILPKDMCDSFVPLILKSVETKETVIERVEFNFDGNEIVLNLTYLPMLDEAGEVEFVIALTEDWTSLERERSEAIASARLASLGHMAANITHEINNPLQLVQLRLFRLEEMINSDSAKKESMLEEVKAIFKTTEKVSKIVESVRRQAKGHAHDKVEKVYVSKLVEEALTYSRNLIEMARGEITLNLKNDGEVNCHHIELEQVLINLISNSCDAITSLEERWIEISSFLDGDEIVLTVKDSGKGIDKEVQKNLMKPFFTTKGVRKGTGLGLNLSKTLTRRNGGKLRYLPEAPNTTFEIRLQKA